MLSMNGIQLYDITLLLFICYFVCNSFINFLMKEEITCVSLFDEDGECCKLTQICFPQVVDTEQTVEEAPALCPRPPGWPGAWHACGSERQTGTQSPVPS